jgi:hypothetical protein
VENREIFSQDSWCPGQDSKRTLPEYKSEVLPLEHHAYSFAAIRVFYTYVFGGGGYEIGMDRLCGLVVRVTGYRSRGPGFDSRRFQIF